MSAATAVPHPVPVDEELAALTLQLEELGVYSEAKKGKHPVGQPPPVDVVYDQFLAELRDYKTFLGDQRLAQSIGEAVNSDGIVIEELTSDEAQANEDHRLALEMSTVDPEIEDPPAVDSTLSADVQDKKSTAPDGIAVTSVTEFSDDETEAGPSMSSAERQADIMNKMSMEFHCCACTDKFPRAAMVTTKCNHRYCIGCIKTLFMRSMHDESLYPPRCCKEPIPLDMVAKHMTSDELAAFKLSVTEYTTRNRTYCSNHKCSRFLAPGSVEPGTKRVVCPDCATETCAICNNTYHAGSDCPQDAALQQTRDLARSMGWQTCYACDRVVVLRSGCNHMTCHCKAEFCYVCGVRWKECRCDTADPTRIEERAEEIVVRDAGPNLLPEEWRRRVDEIVENLRDNHECAHSRRFQRITEGAPRRGFQCELCDARHWNYILQCRRCYLNVCEDCRRNRI